MIDNNVDSNLSAPQTPDIHENKAPKRQYVTLFVKATKLAEMIKGLLSKSVAAFPGESPFIFAASSLPQIPDKRPPIIEDVNLYSDKRLIDWLEADKSVTYRYVIRELGIYGKTPEGCQEMYQLYQGLSKTDHGRLVQQLMVERMQTGKLFLFGYPGRNLNGPNAAVFAQRWNELTNELFDCAIITPLKQPQIYRELNWCHEASHFKVSCFNKGSSACPIVELPSWAQKEFWQKFFKTKDDFFYNPHPKGSLNWRWHEHLKKTLFEHPFTYPNNQVASEIAARVGEFQMGRPGLLKLHGLQEMENMIGDALFTHRPLPEAVAKHMPKAETRLFPLSELNAAKSLPKGLDFLRKIGNYLKPVVTNPITALPVEIYLNYHFSDEKNLWKSLQDGSATWAIGASMELLTACTFGAPAAIALGAAITGAEFLPDLREVAKAYPIPEDLLTNPKYKDNPLLIQSHLENLMALNLIAPMQEALRFLSPASLWSKIKSHGNPEHAEFIVGTYLSVLESLTSTTMPALPIIINLVPKTKNLDLPDFNLLASVCGLADRFFKEEPPQEVHKALLTTYDFLQMLGNVQKTLLFCDPQSFCNASENNPPPPFKIESVHPPIASSAIAPYFSESKIQSKTSLPEWTSSKRELGLWQADFSDCQLSWEVSTNEGKTVVKTQFEIPTQALQVVESMASEVESALENMPSEAQPNLGESLPSMSQSIIIPDGSETQDYNESQRGEITRYRPIEQTEKKLSFTDNLQITDVRIGTAVAGAAGITISILSGAEISIAVTESMVAVNLSVTLGEGFLTALGTGFLYAAPIAAVIISAQLLFSHYRTKNVSKHLKKDASGSKKEIDDVQNRLPAINHLFEQFSKGEIDKAAFLRKINVISNILDRYSHHMKKRGDFAHDHHLPSYHYFSNKAQFEKIHLDLKRIKKNELINHDVEKNFTPHLKGKSIQAIVNELVAGSGQIVSLEKKYQQEALLDELHSRIKNSGDLSALSYLTPLTMAPASQNLQPENIPKPKHISADNIKGGVHHAKKGKDKMMDWANKLKMAYNRFYKCAINFKSLEQLEEAAKDVQEQLDRVNSDDVDLSSYLLEGGGTAADYYDPFISNIKINLDETLFRARALNSGQFPLLSQDELNVLTFNTACTYWNLNSNNLNAENFTGVIEAARILNNLNHLSANPEELKNQTASILNIADEYPDFESYTLAKTRITNISEHILGFQQLFEKDETKTKRSDEETKALWEEANRHAEEFLKIGITSEDIRKLIDSADDSEKLKDDLIAGAKNVCGLYSVMQKINQKTGAIPSPEEVLQIIGRLQKASEVFNETSVILNDDSKSLAEKEVAYLAKREAAKTLYELSYLNEDPENLSLIVKGFIEMSERLPTYQGYLENKQKLDKIKQCLDNIDAAMKDATDTNLSEETREAAFKKADDHAAELLALDISEEDFEKATGNAESAKETKEQITNHGVAIREAYTVYKYESKMPYIYKPLAGLLIHWLQDFERFDGYKHLKLPVQILSTAHVFAPEILPTTLALPVAYLKGDGVVIKRLLIDKVKKTYNNSLGQVVLVMKSEKPLSNLIKGVSSYPSKFLSLSLAEKSEVLHSFAVGLQLAAIGTNAITKKLLGKQNFISKSIIGGVRFTAGSASTASSSFYYVNLGSQITSHYNAGTLIQNFDGISRGVLPLSLIGNDIYEFMATDIQVIKHSKEWALSKQLKLAIKPYLPDLSGNLPESEKYYLGKDLFLTLAYALNPSTFGQGVLQGGLTAYNYLFGCYEDKTLSAILQNYNYRSQLHSRAAIERKQRNSFKRVESILGESDVIKTSDSKVTKSARYFLFEQRLASLENKKILKRTAIEFNEKGEAFFKEVNIEVANAPNALLRRLAVLTATSLREEVLDVKIEIEQLKGYFRSKVESNRSKKTCQFLKSMLKQLQFFNRYLDICYLEKTIVLNQKEMASGKDLKKETKIAIHELLKKTKFELDFETTKAFFGGIKVEDAIAFTFKRYNAYQHLITVEPKKASKFLIIALEEIKDLLGLFFTKGLLLGESDYYEEIREELASSVRMNLISAFIASLVQKSVIESSDLRTLKAKGIIKNILKDVLKKTKFELDCESRESLSAFFGGIKAEKASALIIKRYTAFEQMMSIEPKKASKFVLKALDEIQDLVHYFIAKAQFLEKPGYHKENLDELNNVRMNLISAYISTLVQNQLTENSDPSTKKAINRIEKILDNVLKKTKFEFNEKSKKCTFNGLKAEDAMAQISKRYEIFRQIISLEPQKASKLILLALEEIKDLLVYFSTIDYSHRNDLEIIGMQLISTYMAVYSSSHQEKSAEHKTLIKVFDLIPHKKRTVFNWLILARAFDEIRKNWQKKGRDSFELISLQNSCFATIFAMLLQKKDENMSDLEKYLFSQLSREKRESLSSSFMTEPSINFLQTLSNLKKKAA